IQALDGRLVGVREPRKAIDPLESSDEARVEKRVPRDVDPIAGAGDEVVNPALGVVVERDPELVRHAAGAAYAGVGRDSDRREARSKPRRAGGADGALCKRARRSHRQAAERLGPAHDPVDPRRTHSPTRVEEPAEDPGTLVDSLASQETGAAAADYFDVRACLMRQHSPF